MKPTDAQLRQVEESLSENLADGVRKQAHVEASDVAFIDIALVDKDGNVVEPNDSVHVSMTKIDLNSNFIGTAQAVEPTLDSEAEAPEVIHFKAKGPDAQTETLDTEGSADDFAFTTKSLSPFAFVYTVDFEYEGFTWSMAGESSTWLSTVLSELKVADFGIDDVTDATFSNPELVEVTRQDKDGHRDWQLRSLKAFKTNETLTLRLKDGNAAVIDVTDEGEQVIDPNNTADFQNIRSRLNRVEFFDGDRLVGDNESPNPMLVRPGHEYTMRLYFSDNEDADQPTDGQFPDDGVMYYKIPEHVILSPKAFDENSQVTFDIVLDRKHTLKDNVVTYVPKNGDTPAYIMIQWNENDKENFKLLKASPRTSFMLSFPYTTIEGGDYDDIVFSDTVTLDVEHDTGFDVSLEKKIYDSRWR